MPRETISLPHDVEYLSILGEDGNLDKDLEPDLSDERLLALHRAMLVGRRFNERMLRLQRQGGDRPRAQLGGHRTGEYRYRGG
jgi:pyruvate dehydrogenase E1 component alpha subunit